MRGSLSAGSFVFVLSDFLADADEAAWLEALGHRWDIVPVVIQDPVWEASFPDVAGVVVTYVDADSGRAAARAHAPRRGATAPRRARGAPRRADPPVHRLGLEPVVLTSSDPEAILAAFLGWADARLIDRRAGQ